MIVQSRSAHCKEPVHSKRPHPGNAQKAISVHRGAGPLRVAKITMLCLNIRFLLSFFIPSNFHFRIADQAK